MFRNPRENASLPSSHSPHLPSTGRPPTPPQSVDTVDKQRIVGMLASSPAPNGSTPNTMRAAKKTTPSVSNGKVKRRPNASILSFFKKADGPPKGTSKSGGDEDDVLFFENSGEENGDHSRGETMMAVSDNEDAPCSALEEQTWHFNERHGSLKRRKLDNDGHLDLEVGPGFNEVQDQCSPAPFDKTANTGTGRRKTTTNRQKGFFVDDSDSEDNDDENSGSNEFNLQLPGPADDDRSPDHLHDITRNTADDIRLSKKSSTPPALVHEPTSYGEDEFDDMEDFEAYEFAEEGEEYLERRWVEEYEILEEGAEMGLGKHLHALDSGAKQDREESATSSPACPICSANLSGSSEHEASAHVNACLDGNPTPVPVPASIPEKPPKENQPPNKRFQRAAIARPGQENPFDLTGSSKASTAFSKLMSGHAEDAAWATAAANETASRGKPAYQRTCPFYKILPGLFICVDAFRYGAVQGCNAYFLSHFHSDHYIGLTSSWSHGPIYCSKVTGNLVRQQLKVDPKWVVDLKFEEKSEIPNTQGVQVTMLPANHCPGSSLFLFEKVLVTGKSPKMQRVLHCGDFRACPAHVQHPLLRPEVVDSITGKTSLQRIDVCYLDTTYLTPKFSFPRQEDIIESCAQMCVSLSKDRVDSSDAWEETMRERAGKGMVQFIRKSSGTSKDEADDGSQRIPRTTTDTESRGRLLVVIGTYSIGKERVCLGIARALDCKIYAPPPKMRVCACLEDEELNSRLTTDPLEAQIHMQMLMEIRAETLQEYLNSVKPHFSRIVGFRPTGWNYRPPTSRSTENPAVSTVLHSEGWKSRFRMTDLVPQRGSTKEASCFGVPYSEHSSFRELTMFCCALRIGRVIPTVNVGSKKSRERMKAWIEKWEAEKRKTGRFFTIEEGATAW